MITAIIHSGPAQATAAAVTGWAVVIAGILWFVRRAGRVLAPMPPMPAGPPGPLPRRAPGHTRTRPLPTPAQAMADPEVRRLFGPGARP